jgi:hypothetical protein
LGLSEEHGRSPNESDAVLVKDRHLTPPTRLGQLQQNHTARAVYPLPSEFQRLCLAKAGEETELDKIG